MKLAAPLVALVVLMSFSTLSRAEEAAAGSGGVSGKVTDKDGKAVPGVQVRLFKPFERGPRGDRPAGAPDQREAKPDKPERPTKADRPKPVATATTDADGKFTMTNVPAGDYVVGAMMRGQGGARQPVSVKAGETASVELQLKPREGRPGGPGGPDGSGGKKPAQRVE
ncbi:MAG: carboxypeptidase-like regulatory domain-containing protein [Tepidisphaeraceae bacterium]